VAVRFAPGVRYDMPTFPSLAQTILYAIAVRSGDDEGVPFGRLPSIDGDDAERQGDEKRENCRPQLGTTHVWLWMYLGLCEAELLPRAILKRRDECGVNGPQSGLRKTNLA
jgi:hypothetical protein